MFLNKIFFQFRELLDNNPAKRDFFIIVSFILAFILNFLSLLLIFIIFSQEPEYIILHYNIYFGISSLGSWFMLFINPLIGLLISLINFILVISFYLKNRIISYLLAGFSVLTSVIFFLALILIIYINI